MFLLGHSLYFLHEAAIGGAQGNVVTHQPFIEGRAFQRAVVQVHVDGGTIVEEQRHPRPFLVTDRHEGVLLGTAAKGKLTISNGGRRHRLVSLAIQ